MPVRGIRGANSVLEDEPRTVLDATQQLLAAILESNPSLQAQDIASVLFTLTPDLRSAHPARAARQMGWNQVPLMCAQEIPVPEQLERCVRVLIHWNTDLPQDAIRHVYLGEASSLRPDLSRKEDRL
jgi:chorismate mutase